MAMTPFNNDGVTAWGERTESGLPDDDVLPSFSFELVPIDTGAGLGHSHSAILFSNFHPMGSLACCPSQPLIVPAAPRISISSASIPSKGITGDAQSRSIAIRSAAARATAFFTKALTIASAPFPMSSRMLILRIRARIASYVMVE